MKGISSKKGEDSGEGEDAGKVADEVLQRITKLVGAKVKHRTTRSMPDTGILMVVQIFDYPLDDGNLSWLF